MALSFITPTKRLRPDAAASYKRMQKAKMPAGGINDADRDSDNQRRLFLERYKVQLTGRGPFGDVRWYRGKRYVRTSPLGMVAVPGTSKHELGLALDMATNSAAHKWMLANGAHYGWFRTIKSEPWHWEYSPSRDVSLKEAKAREKAEAARRKALAAQKKAAAKRKLANVRRTLGPLLFRASKIRIANAQRLLGVDDDGYPGPKTRAAYAALKQAAK